MTNTVEFIALGEALHQDKRGFVFFPFQFLEDLLPQAEMCRSCHVIAIAPGQVRGQHQHPQKTEWLYVFHGQGRLFWQLPGASRQERLLTDNRTLVVIAPGIPHALRNDGTDPLYLLAWRAATQGEAGEVDTVAAPLV